MDYIKNILHTLLSAAYTSSWWAAVMFDLTPSHKLAVLELDVLWFIPGISTVVIVFTTIFWLINNWEKD